MSELAHGMSEFGGLTILLARIGRLNFSCQRFSVNVTWLIGVAI